MSEFSLVGKSQQSLSISVIANGFLLLLLVVVVAVWGLTEKWPKPTLLFEYQSSIPEPEVEVFFDLRPALLFDYRSSIPETVATLYFDVGEGLSESHAYAKIVQSSGEWKEVRLELLKAVIHGLRLDPAISPGTIGIRNVRIVDGTGAVDLAVSPSDIRSENQILSRIEKNGTLVDALLNLVFASAGPFGIISPTN